MTQPLNVWFSDGVRYTDYRLDDGRIVTVGEPVAPVRQEGDKT